MLHYGLTINHLFQAAAHEDVDVQVDVQVEEQDDEDEEEQVDPNAISA